MTELAPEHRLNLEKLATYLESGILQGKFDMEVFADGECYPAYRPEANCGSVGCAVGHGPYAGIPIFLDEDWFDYAQRVFGVSLSDQADWEWLFDPQWNTLDNTPQGAAARIRWFLKNGLPSNWYEQLRGRDSLCYAVPGPGPVSQLR